MSAVVVPLRLEPSADETSTQVEVVLTRSATAPRLVLLIAWYIYFSWGAGLAG